MKLISLLKIMDESDEIAVLDESAPIIEMDLFRGTVADCKQQGYFRNGIITALFAEEDILCVAVNIEHQKKKGGSIMDGGELSEFPTGSERKNYNEK